VVIVALAVGIPYFFTHKRMRDPHDTSDSREYLGAKRRRRWQRNAVSAQHQHATDMAKPYGSGHGDDGPAV
jgi:hypothetical protein